MLPNLKRDADGGLDTLRPARLAGRRQGIQLAARAGGPFFVVMRLYWPKPDALNGKWTAPPLQKTN